MPKRLLGDYAGYLQTDCYSGYDAVCAQKGNNQLGCWAYARRKFDEARKAQPKSKGKIKNKTTLAEQALLRIQLLYRIERKAKNLSDDERLALRQAQAKPALEALHEWLTPHLPLVPPQSALGKAMGYLHKQWGELDVYGTNGRLRMDNNHVENAIRPFVIGRKNHLFCDSVAGTNASTNFYNLIETAKANGIEQYAYLKQLFSELPQAGTVEDIEALLPIKSIQALCEAA